MNSCRRRGNERGQASIMIGMMMLTLLLFFAFVINTGVLVNAKINLQNAADLAAYAGASVQARQLNYISYLNYEMRRQYKKFLFRYLVLGNMGQESFLQSNNGPRNWCAKVSSVSGGPPACQPGAPAVCVTFNSTDNFCKLNTLPAIDMPAQNILDQINSVLIGQLKQIEQIRQAGCVAIGKTNIQLLLLWLYNTDPTLTDLEQKIGAMSGIDADTVAILRRVKGMSLGLGLLPREVITAGRIKTLQYYVNADSQKGISKGQVDGLLTSPDPAKWERTIQAYYSAYYTLGNHSFQDPDGIVMDELLPQGTDGAALLTLKPITTTFDTMAIDMQISGGAAPSGSSANCDMVPIKFPVSNLPVGFYKAPEILTYYAIRLSGTARLLFSPWGDMKLKAYAAAQPFGSRIGPQLQDTDFATANRWPSLPIASGKTWLFQNMIQAVYGASFPGSATNVQIGDSAHPLDKAYATAMVPNDYESGKYNIMADANPDPFVMHFQTLSGNNVQRTSFWAPIVPPDKQGDIKDQIKAMISAGRTTQQNAMSGDALLLFQQSVANGIMTYWGALMAGTGEGGEGKNIAVLDDPLHYADQKPIVVPGVSMNDPAKIKTSWSVPKDARLGQLGRSGYSVKFVSFQTLTGQSRGVTADGNTTWTNVFSTDAQGEGDIPFLQH